MKGAPAGRNLDRDQLGLDPFGRCRLAQLPVGVLGTVELLDHSPSSGPAMRATHVLDGSLSDSGVLEGDPAADPIRRDGPLFVTRILVEAQCLAARGLPQHIVLAQSRARPLAEARTGPTDVGPGTTRAMVRSDFQALQIWRVRSGGLTPVRQFHSSG